MLPRLNKCKKVTFSFFGRKFKTALFGPKTALLGPKWSKSGLFGLYLRNRASDFSNFCVWTLGSINVKSDVFVFWSKIQNQPFSAKKRPCLGQNGQNQVFFASIFETASQIFPIFFAWSLGSINVKSEVFVFWSKIQSRPFLVLLETIWLAACYS